MSVRVVPIVVKVTHGKSSHRINIPMNLVKKMGLDEVGYVLLTAKSKTLLEVERYDREEDEETDF